MTRLVVVLSLVGAWTAACSSSGNGTSTANSAHTVADFAYQYCRLIEPCCADAGLSTSGSQCFDQMSGSGTLEPYNPAAGQDCLDAMLAASKSRDLCIDLADSLPQCSNVFGVGGSGPAGAGEPCTSSADCAVDASCNPTTHKCTPLVTTGHPCQADQDCVTSDYCASGSCQQRVAVGGACGNTSGPECVSTAYCDSGTCESVSMGGLDLATICGK